MLGEYKVGRCTQQCYTLQRPLRSGEWYYSVVVEEGDDLQRREYSAEAGVTLRECCRWEKSHAHF